MSHLTRTRHAHQVTALALAKLQEDAFELTEGEHSDTDKEVWRQKMILESPTFQYWDTILSMELLGLILIRSHRDQIEQHVPFPECWGWTLAVDTWIPVWTKLPIAAQVCSELIKCGCKSKNGCGGSRCACKNKMFSCHVPTLSKHCPSPAAGDTIYSSRM